MSEHTPQEGSRLHRMLQKEAGSLYQKEVSLKIEVPLNGHNYCVEGRADGIFVKETGQVVIDEICRTGKKHFLKHLSVYRFNTHDKYPP